MNFVGLFFLLTLFFKDFAWFLILLVFSFKDLEKDLHGVVVGVVL